MCQWSLDGFAIILGTLAPFTQEQWTSLLRESYAFRPNVRGHDGREASNVCLQRVPITLHWSRITNHNMCNMWTLFGAIVLFYNVLPNTKARIMCWYSCMSATWGPSRPSRICQLWKHIGLIEMPCFDGNFFVPKVRWPWTDWTIHNVVRAWEEMDDIWLKPNHNSDNIMWTDVQCNHDWQSQKHPKMLVFKN